jgi:hypothetical protein
MGEEAAAVVPVITAYLGSVNEFDPDREEWVNYKQRLDIWMSVNKIQDGDKAHVFLAKVGPKAFEVLVNLSSPANVAEKSYKELCDYCEKHYKVVRTQEGERVAFRNCKQKPGQGIADFILELKKLSRYCNYTNVNEALKETFLANLNNQFIRAKVLGDCTGKDFATCCDKALTLEKIYQETQVYLQKTPAGVSSGAQNVNQVRARCHRCNGGHNPEYCRYKSEVCFKCKRRGHIGRACRNSERPESSTQSEKGATAMKTERGRGSSRSRGRGRGRGKSRYDQSKVQYMESATEIDDLSDALHSLFSVTHDKGKSIPPEVSVTLEVAGVNVDFVVDTAAPVSVIPVELYNKHFSHVKLHKDDLGLRSFTQNAIPVRGSMEVPVRYSYMQQSAKLTLYVVEGPACLLGRQWLKVIRLNWPSLFAVRTDSSLDGILNKYADVFGGTLGTIKDFKADIQVQPDAKPRFHKPRNLPYALRDKVAAELDALEARGVMSKINRSDWAAPLVVVPKANGGLRLCGDYKVTINQVIVPEPYPLPSAEDLFASLANGRVFTKLDLSTAYQQVELTDESKQYLVINTHKGLYKLHRLSYGVSTAPNLFQRIMDQVLQDIPDVVCYLDDILIATGESDHLARVEMVLQRLQSFGIKVKREKCEFLMDSVQYLGHVVSKDGLKPSTEKVEALQKMKAPRDVKELRVLLGLVNYYSKFIPNQANMLAPWYNLLRKDAVFVWNSKCEQVLQEVKQRLTDCKTLAHYDPSKQLTLACDAGPDGVGCVLSHEFTDGERPIAYASRTLTSAEKNYCQLEREGLAIVYGLRKFHKYLYGRRFTIITDNRPIARILGPKTGIPSLAALRLQRWALLTMAYDYDLRTRRSQDHANCDALSRLPGGHLASELDVNYFSYVDNLPVTARDIREATRNDPVLAQVLTYALNGWPNHCADEQLRPYFNRKDQMSVDNGCLLWGMRIIIPPKFQERLLQELHTDHPGVVRMKMVARSYFWFPNLDMEIETLVRSCAVCQGMRNDSPKVPLIPWSYPDRVWERIHLDFADLNGQNYMIVVDSHSKWIEVIEMKSITTNQTIIELRKIFASNGLPEILVTDNGPQLVSYDFEHFLKLNGVRHVVSAPYHPATNGAAERTVQTVKSALKKHLLTQGTSGLAQKLQSFLLTYRTTPQSTTGRTPAELFMKRQLRTRFSLLRPNVHSDVIRKQEIMKENHDKKSGQSVLDFQIGEIVRVKNFRDGLEKYGKGVIAKKAGTLSVSCKNWNPVQVRAFRALAQDRRVGSKSGNQCA